jgi:hypothetical protein
LKKGGINNLNRSIINNDTEMVIKNFLTKKSPDPEEFDGEFY